jgi:hypothetical protein
MSKKLVFTVTAPMPDDEMDRAELLGKIKPHRDVFLAAIKETGITGHAHDTRVITEKVTAPEPRARRGTAATQPDRAAAE